MTDDELYNDAVLRGAEAVRALIARGWRIADAHDEAMRRVADATQPGSLMRAGAEWGVEAATWEAMGYADGLAGAPKARPPQDVLPTYLHGYRLGATRRQEMARRAQVVRAQAQKEAARGQGGPGVQLRLVRGGKPRSNYATNHGSSGDQNTQGGAGAG